jgi:hypothetical protein
VCFAHDEWRNFAATVRARSLFFIIILRRRVEYNFCNGVLVGGFSAAPVGSPFSRVTLQKLFSLVTQRNGWRGKCIFLSKHCLSAWLVCSRRLRFALR